VCVCVCVCVKERRFVLQDSFNRDWFEDAHDVELYACYNMHPMKSPGFACFASHKCSEVLQSR